jgi:electron transfer flavoprotein beta subunit
MGANVTVLDRSIPRMSYLDDVFMGRLTTQYSSAEALEELLPQADMIIGAVLVPGAAAPKLISRAQLARMRPGAALVDVAIDQGGCFETSKPTTHQDPIYEVDGIMHYCVANMPGAVPRTSTLALGNATMPFMLALANKGWKKACEDDPHLLNGLNTHAGHLTYYAVGKALGIDVLAPKLALAKYRRPSTRKTRRPDAAGRRFFAVTTGAEAVGKPKGSARRGAKGKGFGMKILVPVKRVIDYNVKVRVKADGSGVDLANVKMSMNPFDEIAVEEAIRLKEKGVAEEIVAVSIGVKQAQETLRTALAMGADRAILIVAADDVHTDIEPLAVAKLLKAVIDEEQPGLVLCGKQAIDNDMNATGQMLSALLGWSQAAFASEVVVEGGHALVTREVDGGLQTIKVKMPAIVTVDLRLNEPRYASLPNIMKAKKKQLDEKTPADYGVDVAPRLTVVKTSEPAGRKAGVKVGSVDELIAKLKDEAGVI